jgi:hypothetical protein
LVTDDRFSGGENGPFEIVAVQSGWRDRSDLFGYYNSFEKRYKETDFFRALYCANLPKYKDVLFFIVLDEMNCHVQSTISLIFSRCWKQSENERFIRLEGVPSEAYPEIISRYEGKLPIPPNVRFIGTANHDESTLEFAPKTIDRSNLMEMPKNADRKEGIANPDASFNVTYPWLREQFSRAEKTYEKDFEKFRAFTEKKELRDLFSDKNLGAGNRLDDQAKRFISVYRAADGNLVMPQTTSSPVEFSGI